MDRPLEDSVISRRRNVRVALTVGVLALFALAFTKGTDLLKPSVARTRLRTARVDRGPLVASLSATGTVLPAVETVLSSPIDARVMRILKRPGDRIAAGDAILELDLSTARLAVEKLDRDLSLRETRADEARLALKARLNELLSQRKVREVRLESARARAAQSRKLASEGLVSGEVLRESDASAREAEIELAQTEEAARIAGESSEAQLRGLALEIATLRAERAEAERQRQLGTTRAERSGVLTWTLTEEGAPVRRGDVLARLADLASFRVDATISEIHAQKLVRGTPVVVRVNDVELLGSIVNVNPALSAGVATFTVALEDAANAVLRANLRVDVSVLTDRRDGVLRLPRGAFARGEGLENVFVVKGDRALRHKVTLGVSSLTHFEVLSGLAEGDEAVISDTTDYVHAREVRIR